MLKKHIKDSSGSALIVAVMVMLVVFILVASFVGNVTASTRIDTDSVALDQAYLVAKSGMRFLEDTIDNGVDGTGATPLTGSQVKTNYNGATIEITHPDGSRYGTCDVKVTDLDVAQHQYNIEVTGKYNNTTYRLYMWKAIPDEEATTEATTSGNSTARKAAIIDYNRGNGQNQFNIGVVGPVLYLGNTTNVFQNGNGSSAGNVASRGSVVLGSSNDNEGYQSIFSRQKVSFDHSMNIYGEIYCHEFDATATGNHVHIYNTIYAESTLSIGGANSDFKALVSGGEMNIGGDGAVVDGNVTSGGNLNLGLAAKYNPQNGFVTINGDIYCKGNVLIKYQNPGNIKINGSIYATGSVIIQDSSGNTVYSSANKNLNDTKGIVTGQIYSGLGARMNDPRYTGTIYLGGTSTGADILSGKFDDLVESITKKLDDEVPVENAPTTHLPGDNAYQSRVYNSLSDITNAPYEKDGFMVYTITESGTINFPLDQALSTQVNGKYPAILIDTLSNESSPKKIDLYVTSNFKLDDPYGNGNCGKIMVNDHDHSGLVRFFLASGIDVKLNCQSGSSGQYWLVLPLNDAGNIDWNYVPNLYVFSLETTVGKDMGRFGSQNGRPCFPGYWLTPNLSTYTTTTSGFVGNDATAVTETNCPRVHGMLAVQSASFQPTGETIIKFYDPDTAPNQKWFYSTVINGVYQVES